MVPALAIELALDHKPSHREMTSRLISVLYLKVLELNFFFLYIDCHDVQVISQRDIGQAFDFLLRQVYIKFHQQLVGPICHCSLSAQ